jgi:predicted component of type VI protein secretion system
MTNPHDQPPSVVNQVLANAWKETVRDAVADVRAHREAAKVGVRRQVRSTLINE